MQPIRDRLARIDDFRRAPKAERALRRLRWAASFVALAVLACAAPAAQASPGGASPVASSPAAGQELAFSPFKSAEASWYGPGLYGNKTACGQTLRATTIGVAHRNLPCGTMVKFVYHGHAVIAPVIDRGPYVKGRAWDLTAAASEALQLEGVGMVHYAIAVTYARPTR
ncbi:MAG TPA: septal ring lytic transglycosylase RlpA family protein [Solirubrobacterales bacterium]|jgi:rare lipoprotein A (peptidoglycan hydrolase)|nr:septal ring lytic transglycosylase RlpA family protein [Solirubrobacterales bacterium]